MKKQELSQLYLPEEIPILKEKLLVLSLLGLESSETFFNFLYFLYKRAGKLEELAIINEQDNFLTPRLRLIQGEALTEQGKKALTAKREKERRRRMAVRLFEDRRSISKDPLLCKARSVFHGKVQILTPLDEDFPEQLLEIPDPPSVLYLKGNSKILTDFSITIVGSRKSSKEGLQTAKDLADILSTRGAVIVSGLALGVDAMAHRGTLEKKAKTIAILPCGIDRIYPSAHKELAKKILEQGGSIITEFPPNRPPLKINFHRRNRLLSGLSQGTIVIEAAERSGTMITSYAAASQGKDVFAVPGSIYRFSCKGTNQLLKDGAILVSSAEDIFQAYPDFFRKGQHNKERREQKLKKLSDEERSLYILLQHETLKPDEILEKTGLPMAKMWKILTKLQMENLIFQGDDHCFFLCQSLDG